MGQTTVLRTLGLLACGVFVGGLLVSHWERPVFARAAAAGQAEKAPPPDLATLQADVLALKSNAPTQSHVMADVAIQFGNLWFAGQRKNWPLATYYLSETRGRMNWVIRINPAVKAQVTGELVDIRGIFDGIDIGTMAPLKAAIDKKNSIQFVAAYKAMLISCYACHKAVGRPYLRPMVPLTLPQPIINVDPNALWPL